MNPHQQTDLAAFEAGLAALVAVFCPSRPEPDLAVLRRAWRSVLFAPEQAWLDAQLWGRAVHAALCTLARMPAPAEVLELARTISAQEALRDQAQRLLPAPAAVRTPEEEQAWRLANLRRLRDLIRQALVSPPAAPAAAQTRRVVKSG